MSWSLGVGRIGRVGRRSLLGLLALALVGSGVWWKTRPEPIAVSAYTVVPGPVEATVSNTRAGSIEACQRTRLSTIVGGRIAYLGVKEGDRVKAGQVMLRLWNEDQVAQIRLAETQVGLAQRRVAEACLVAENAEREAVRQSQLRAQGFISSSKDDASRTEAQARRAACQTAEADVRQAQARLRSAQVEQGRTTLKAPFAGTVASIVGELGEYSTPSPPGISTPPAIDLIDPSCLYVNAPMDEVDAPRIRPGQAARITLDALPGKSFVGRVRRVAPYVQAIEKQARTVDVEVDFADRKDFAGLLVGYSADVEILLQRRDAVLRIPTAAIQEGKRVLVVNPDTQRLEARTIQTGVANWEYTEVIGGLEAGAHIVTALDQEGVVEGALVRMTPAATGTVP